MFITGRRQPELARPLTNWVLTRYRSGRVGAPADLDRLYAEVDAAGQGLDIVVADAGSTRVARLGEITEDDLDTLLTTNVKGVVCTRAESSAAAQRRRVDHPDRVHHSRPWSSGAEPLRRIEGRRALVDACRADESGQSGHPGRRPRGGIDRDTGERQSGGESDRVSSVEEFGAAVSRPSRWVGSPILSRSPTPKSFWPAICPASRLDPPSPPTVGSTRSDVTAQAD